MARYPLSALAALLLLLTGCDLIEREPQPRAQILPLAVGNQWIFDVTLTRSGPPPSVTTRTDTIRVTGDTLISGERWFRISRTLRRGYLATSRADGIWTREGGAAPVLAYKYPARSGVEFGSAGGTRAVIDANAHVTVPAGSYRAVHYVSRQDSVRAGDGMYAVPDSLGCETYLAPGVGFVKEEQPYVWVEDDTLVLAFRQTSVLRKVVLR